jgi:hypothetical protein
MTIELPGPLIDDIAEGKCLPFVGAGFSLNGECDEGYSMPDWVGLASRLGKLARVEKALEGPDAATAYERQFGRVHLIDEVRRSLNPEHVKPGKAHKALVQLPFDTIYTTNFDLLLEDTLQALAKPFRSLVGELQLPFHAGLFTTNLVKMHGDIRHEEHFVITRNDYERFLENYPVIATHLSAMLIVRTPFFVGYSRTDSDFLQIQSVIKSRLGLFQRMPYIVQFDSTPEEVEIGLDQNIHILNISTEGGISKSDALADLFDAIQIEVAARAGKELRSSEPDAFEEVAPSTLDLTYRAADASDLLESSSSLCFVMMPFTRETESVYWNLIKPAVEEVGLTPLRADQISSPGSITQQIFAAIRESRVCVADVSAGNANVLYELGLAQAIGKPVLLIAQHDSRAPFDIANMRYIAYDPEELDEASAAMVSMLLDLLESNKLNEAQTLINNGMYRAAVAIMGVILEHALQNAIRRADILVRRRLASSAQMADVLFQAGALGEPEVAVIRSFADIRNRAVHHLEEPSSDDAKLALGLLNRILQSLESP